MNTLNPTIGSESRFGQKIFDRIYQLVQSFFDVPRHILVLKMSLFFVLMFTSSRWSIHIPLRILAMYMLIDRRFSTHKIFWGLITFGHFLIVATEWDYIDNHKYLSLYWMMTCFVSLYEPTEEEANTFVLTSARRLIGLVFFFATLWKFLGGQFVNGKFFHYTFITDRRFEFFTGYLTNITRDQLPQNYRLLAKMLAFPQVHTVGQLISPPLIKTVAIMISWWVIFIEGMVALTFLLPDRFTLGRYRDVSLLTFILTTYAIVSVPGFNYLLVLFGISQLPNNSRKIALFYLLALAISEMRKVPFLEYAVWIYQHLFIF